MGNFETRVAVCGLQLLFYPDYYHPRTVISA